LRAEDLSYKPSPDARTTEQTIDHILSLSALILKPIKGEAIVATEEELPKLSFEENRKTILYNLKEASDLFLSKKVKIAKTKITFITQGKKVNTHFGML
jgi:hypothetical protein